MVTLPAPDQLSFTPLRATLAALPPPSVPAAPELLREMRHGLRNGQAAVRAGFEHGGSAEAVHRDFAFLVDGLIGGALDFAERRLYGTKNPTKGELFAVVAVGGYGRGELAPGSDIDLLFLTSYKRTPQIEQMTEFLLYKLWDLGLKVGQATRSVRECVRLAAADLSVRTALLEARLLWGSTALFDELQAAYAREIVAGHGDAFVAAKLAERDERHRRTGDSRFLLEPNLKEGKGGLRDLHTLMWIGRFLCGATTPADLARHGLLTRQGLAMFLRSRRFLWTVRCHLHYLAGRAEERLTFDVQPAIARAMGYRENSKQRAVERFMKRWYLTSRDVGAVTRIVIAALEERHAPRGRFGLHRLTQRKVGGFVVQGRRLALGDPHLFERQPVKMLELFHLAQARGLDIHPTAMSAVTANLKGVDAALRESPDANQLFLDMLCSRSDPALTLGRMNEVGLLGRFIPDFGRVVAQVQHNLYHVYTVDEHIIRAVGVLAQIERGELAAELPVASELMPKLISRRELYVATLLHDVGKGRLAPHSEVGEAIAKRLCPRFGLSEDATETVAWLIRHHLVMSTIAFRRDTEDPQTIADFVGLVQSPERLRLLLILTTADIRAVGPGVWNGWKGQLLRELYGEAQAAMATGDPQGRRAERIERAKEELAKALAAEGAARRAAEGGTAGDWDREAVAAYVARHDPRYWLAFPAAIHARHARVVREADATRAPVALDFRTDAFRARTELLLYAADHPGLFMKVAGALALSRVSIVEARIFTTGDGMALDTLGFQDAAERTAVDDPARLARIREQIRKALGGEIWLEKALQGRRSLPQRADVFKVEPRVLADNAASRTHSVIEVNGRDRPGLLFDLARTLKDLGLVITSAHVATYGERVVDVFYVKDVFGLKVTHRSKLQRINRQLTEVLTA